jgi:hypothetical protein
VTGTIEYIREGKMRIKTTYGYVVVYTLPKVTGIDLKPKVAPEAGAVVPAKLKLRSEPTTFSSKDDILRMVREKEFSAPSDRIAGMFVPQYEEKALNGVSVVIEHNTGLIWQKTGSAETMDYTGAQNYVILLNRQRHAGFSDWRLPTMEELLSLMEPVKQGEMFIDPVFETQNDYYWSADKDSSGYVWVVRFSDGGMLYYGPYYNYVRAVRSRP